MTRPRIEAELLRSWWCAGVRITDIAGEFGVSPGTVRRAAIAMGLGNHPARSITLAQYRAHRRAMIADLQLAIIQRDARAIRGAMAVSEMVDVVASGKLTRWQMGAA